MADRDYSTKTRAKRIALDYFKRPHPFRRAKLLLSVGVPVAAAVVVAGFTVFGDFRLYNSGPVSTAHAMFGARCQDCHGETAVTAAGVTSNAAFFVPVSDRACSVCHDGPIHHDAQPFTPTCASCHFEHKGRSRLVDLRERQCTQCHGGLSTKEGRAPGFAKNIASFSSGHPEFAVASPDDASPTRVRLDAVPGPTDSAQTCLNHQKHLKPGLVREDSPWYRKGMPGVLADSNGLRLSCTYCHRPAADGAYMEPINYGKHCADCHPLVFDNDRFPGATVPHDRPEIVHAFLRTKYTESPGGERPAKPAAPATAEPARPRRTLRGLEPVEEVRPSRRLVGRGESDDTPQPRAPKGFKDVETLLFFKNKESTDTCLLCHTLTVPQASTPAVSCAETNGTPPSEAAAAIDRVRAALKGAGGEKLPAVVPPRIPSRWLPHSHFDHRTHRPLACAECHKAPDSVRTADVLLPSVKVCRQCHRDPEGARTACVECHRYHDPARERDTNGPLTIRRLVDGRPASTPAAR
jgi:hypothetical protein